MFGNKDPVLHHLFFILALLIFLSIFYLSSIPASGFHSGLGIKTKIYHWGIFFLLAFFLLLTFVKRQNMTIFVVILLSLSYAISDELHQFLVPGRNCSVSDFFIDSLGIFSAGVFFMILYRFLEKD